MLPSWLGTRNGIELHHEELEPFIGGRRRGQDVSGLAEETEGCLYANDQKFASRAQERVRPKASYSTNTTGRTDGR